jgi:flagellar hook-length control protein FliK
VPQLQEGADSSAAATQAAAAAAVAPASPAATSITVSEQAAATAAALPIAIDADADSDQSALDAGSTPSGAAGKVSARRTTSSDVTDAGQLSAQAAWLMMATMSTTPGGAVGIAATAGAPQTDAREGAEGAAAASAGLAGLAGAVSTASGASAGASVSAGTAGHAFSAQDLSLLLGGGASALALGTAGTALNQGASNDADDAFAGASAGTSGSSSAASDRARDAADVSNNDLATIANFVSAGAVGSGPAALMERAIGAPVGDPGWSHAVAAQVQMMASANIQSATLRLSPEHLGPLEVHIDMQSAQINVNFIAAHPETRSALEQSVPTLRAMLAHGGLTLGQAQVRGEARSGSQSSGTPTRDGQLDASENAPVIGRISRGVGLIDEYA